MRRSEAIHFAIIWAVIFGMDTIDPMDREGKSGVCRTTSLHSRRIAIYGTGTWMNRHTNRRAVVRFMILRRRKLSQPKVDIGLFRLFLSDSVFTIRIGVTAPIIACHSSEDRTREFYRLTILDTDCLCTVSIPTTETITRVIRIVVGDIVIDGLEDKRFANHAKGGSHGYEMLRARVRERECPLQFTILV